MHATWSNPVALLALLPWVAAYPWLRRGSRGHAVQIPFLTLWKTASPSMAAQRRWLSPSLPVLIVWLAAGVAILAAAGLISSQQVEGSLPRPNTVRILQLSARAGPVSQVMLRLSHMPGIGPVAVQIDSRGRTTRQAVAADGAPHFSDVPSLGPTLRVTGGGISAEATAEHGWPALVTSGQLPDAVRRFVAVYTAHRPPTAPAVLLTPAAAGVSGAAVEVVNGGGGGPASGSVAVGTSPVTANVRSWPGPADPHAVPLGGFVPQVRQGGVVLVATAELPALQVWLNLDWSAWRDSDDAVVLLANAVEWAGSSGDPIYRSTTAAAAPTAEQVTPPAPIPPAVTRWSGRLCVAGVVLAAAAVLPAWRKSSA